MGNRYDRKLQYVGIVLSILLIICMIGLLATDYMKVQDYVEVKATYQGITVKAGIGKRTRMAQIKTQNYTFEYDGRLWEASRPTLFGNNEDIGKEVLIRCNPLNPEELENISYRRVEIFIILASVLSIVAVKRSM